MPMFSSLMLNFHIKNLSADVSFINSDKMKKNTKKIKFFIFFREMSLCVRYSYECKYFVIKVCIILI